MKNAHFLTGLFLIVSLCTLQAQNKDRVVHLKKYDFGASSTQGLYLSAEKGEEEVIATKISQPGDDETFTLEFVSGEDYQFYCHVKTYNQEYVVVEDGMLIVSGKEKPTKTFMVLWEGQDDRKENYYRIWFDEKVGIDISRDGEAKADGSSAGFFLFKDVADGFAVNNSIREDISNYRLTVFTSNGVLTETSSDINLIVYYTNDIGSKYDQTFNCGKLGGIGNKAQTKQFSVDGYVYKVELVNKGQGLNQTWRVGWVELQMERGMRYERLNRWTVNDWINPDMSRFFTF